MSRKNKSLCCDAKVRYQTIIWSYLENNPQERHPELMGYVCKKCGNPCQTTEDLEFAEAMKTNKI